MGTCTAFVFAALVEFTFVNHTWRTKGRLPGIPTGLETRDYVNMSQSNGNGDQNKNLLNLEEVNEICRLTFIQRSRPAGKLKLRKPDQQTSGSFSEVKCYTASTYTTHTHINHFRWRRTALAVDEMSRFLFPLGFLVFNLSYWFYFLSFLQVYNNTYLVGPKYKTYFQYLINFYLIRFNTE